MAKITLSDLAPNEAVRFIGWQVDLELGGSGKKSVETDDHYVIGFANEHPWLNVEYSAAATAVPDAPDTLAEHPERDVLSGLLTGRVDPNDPAEIKKAEDAKAVERGELVALDAGLDQSVVVETGPVAETLAADEGSQTAAKADSDKKDKN